MNTLVTQKKINKIRVLFEKKQALANQLKMEIQELKSQLLESGYDDEEVTVVIHLADDSLKEEIVSLEEQKGQLTLEVSGLKTEKKQEDEALARKVLELETLNHDIEAASIQFNNFQEEYDHKTQIAREVLEALEGDSQKLKAENQQLSAQNTQLKQQNQILSEKLPLLEQAFEQKQRKNDELEQQNIALGAEQIELDGKVNLSQGALKEIDAEIDQKIKSFQRKERDLNIYERRIRQFYKSELPQLEVNV